MWDGKKRGPKWEEHVQRSWGVRNRKGDIRVNNNNTKRVSVA